MKTLIICIITLPFLARGEDPFSNYWYKGLAELTRYDLTQARYGEQHHGDAVLIFVTEDFLTGKQVKKERPSSQDAVSILKLNSTKNFLTGIYPYSLMTSTFTPVRQPDKTLKISTTAQEWCGHTYIQLNRRAKHHEVRAFSYFESEGDIETQLALNLTEDGVLSWIRLEPETLPQGELIIIPGTQFIRLRHQPIAPQHATATLSTHTHSQLGDVKQYEIKYRDIDRSLTIWFQESFPHQIEGWQEKNMSGFGPHASIMTTTAIKTHRLQTAYWSENTNKDRMRRKELGLAE